MEVMKTDDGLRYMEQIRKIDQRMLARQTEFSEGAFLIARKIKPSTPFWSP